MNRIFDLNNATVVTVLYKLWQLFSGLVTLLAVAEFLSPTQLGYYFTMISYLALQSIFELGMTSVFTTVTSHEIKNANILSSNLNEIEGDDLAKMSVIYKKIINRSTRTSLIFFVVCVTLGYIGIGLGGEGYNLSWCIPWFILVAINSLRIYVIYSEGFLEGVGGIAHVAKTRLLASFCSCLILWISLFAGFGLYSVAVASCFLVVVPGSIYHYRYKKLLALMKGVDKSCVDLQDIWGVDIQRFQTKIAFSWFCGYLLFQFFVPIVFYIDGAVAAGVFGFGLTIANSVNSISGAWVTTKIPEVSRIASNNDMASLRNILTKTVRIGTLVSLGLSLIILIGYFILQFVNQKLFYRFPSVEVLFILLLTTCFNQYITTVATFVRCFKVDPYLKPTFIGAIVAPILAVILTIKFGMIGSAVAYMLSMLLVLLPISFRLHSLIKHDEFKLSIL